MSQYFPPHILKQSLILMALLLMSLGLGLSPVLSAPPAIPPMDTHTDGQTIAPLQDVSGTWGPGTLFITSDVTIDSGVTIDILPNTIILVSNGAGLTVEGSLNTQGPVTLTSAAATPQPGDWNGITFAPGSQGTLDGLTVEYASQALVLNTSNSLSLLNGVVQYNLHFPPASTNAEGAGLHILQGSPLISNTYIHSNTVFARSDGEARGAGIYIEAGSPSIINSRIEQNIAEGIKDISGGGIAISGGSPLIQNNRIISNTIDGSGYVSLKMGAGIGVDGNSTAIIRQNWIAGNRNEPRNSLAGGGGIGLASNGTVDLIDSNVIYNNYVSSTQWCEGLGIDTWDQTASATIINNLIVGNTNGVCGGNSPFGGGINANGSSAGTRIINNTIVDNRAVDDDQGDGGGLYLQGGVLVVYNNIVANNTAGKYGGGIRQKDNSVTLGYNNIFGNTAPTGADVFGVSGINNISVDPLFNNTGDVLEKYHLRHDSPMVDAGLGSISNAPSLDYDGQARPFGDDLDMGFDEVHPPSLSLRASASNLGSNDVLTYQVRLENDPYAALLNAQLGTQVPISTTYASGPTCTPLGQCAYNAATQAITWTGSLAGQQVMTLTFSVSINAGLADDTDISNQATLQYSTQSITSNLVTTRINNPQFALSQQVSGPLIRGLPLTYTLTVSNTSPQADASTVVLSATLPANASYLSGGTRSGNNLLWTIDQLPADSAVERRYSVETCQPSLTADTYRVVRSDQGVDSGNGPALTQNLQAPTLQADFVTSLSQTLLVDQSLYFTSTSTTNGANLQSWAWDFGDGNTATGPSASHSYTAPGVYTITLSIKDACGFSDSVDSSQVLSQTVEVLGGLDIAIQGQGQVDGDPDQAAYALGDVVTLTAEADLGWAFESWAGDASGSINPLVLTIDGRKSLTATFTPLTYSLSVNKVGQGSVLKVPQKASYTYGEAVTLLATPADDWRFAGWSGDVSGTAMSITLTMTASQDITATFEPDEFTLDVSIFGQGSVTKSPDKASYALNEVVTLHATPESGWAFQTWRGDVISTSKTISLTMNADKVLAANFVEAPYQLSVDILGQGQVSVVPPRASYVYSESVILMADPDPGWLFLRWEGDVPPADSTDNPLVLLIDGDKSLTARFVKEAYLLDVSSMGQGSVTVSPQKTGYAYGEVVTLTATANPGWSFANWMGDSTTTAATLVITMEDDIALTAAFVAESYSLENTIIGQGSVQRQPNKARYTYGEVVTLTAQAQLGWTFAGWEDDLVSVENPITLTMDAGKSVTARFTKDSYTLTTRLSGQGQVRISPQKADYAYGEVVTLTATPDPGWQFSRWSGDAQGNSNPLVIIMDSDTSLLAQFSQSAYRLEVEEEGSGQVQKQPDQITYRYSDTVTLTATPAPGWDFVGWDGDITSTANPLTLTVEADTSLTARFVQQAFTLDVTPIGQGQVVATPDRATYVYGDVVTLTAEAAAGWEFAGWSGDVASSVTPLSLTMESNVALTATFSEIEYAPALTLINSGPQTATLGDAIPFTYTLSHNTSQGDGSPIEILTVVDDKAGPATFVDGDANGDDRLSIGETWIYTGSYLSILSDESPLTNTLMVQAQDQNGDLLTQQATHSTVLLQPSQPVSPAMVLQIAGPLEARVGDSVVYTITLTQDLLNGDGSPIAQVSVNEARVGNLSRVAGDVNSNALLEVGESWRYRLPLTPTVDDLGNFTSLITATGRDLDDDLITTQTSRQIEVLAAITETTVLYLPIVIR